MEELHVLFGISHQARFFDGNIQRESLGRIVEVDSADLSDGIRILELVIRDACIIRVGDTPCHDPFVEDAASIEGLAFAEFHSLLAAGDGLGIIPVHREIQDLERLRNRALRVFSAEFGETFRGRSGPAGAKENPLPPARPLPARS